MLQRQTILVEIDGDPVACRLVYRCYGTGLVVYSLLDSYHSLRSAAGALAIMASLRRRESIEPHTGWFADLRTFASDRELGPERWRYFLIVPEMNDQWGVGVRFEEVECPLEVQQDFDYYIHTMVEG